jgi:hypothetical protein
VFHSERKRKRTILDDHVHVEEEHDGLVGRGGDRVQELVHGNDPAELTAPSEQSVRTGPRLHAFAHRVVVVVPEFRGSHVTPTLITYWDEEVRHQKARAGHLFGRVRVRSKRPHKACEVLWPTAVREEEVEIRSRAGRPAEVVAAAPTREAVELRPSG